MTSKPKRHDFDGTCCEMINFNSEICLSLRPCVQKSNIEIVNGGSEVWSSSGGNKK